MRRHFRRIWTVVAIIGLAGLPDNLQRLLEWSKVLNWSYWLNSGEWIPWGIRAIIVGTLAYLAVSPELVIRIRSKIYPRWPDGKPMGYGYIFRWHLEGIKYWWEDRKFKNSTKPVESKEENPSKSREQSVLSG